MLHALILHPWRQLLRMPSYGTTEAAFSPVERLARSLVFHDWTATTSSPVFGRVDAGERACVGFGGAAGAPAPCGAPTGITPMPQRHNVASASPRTGRRPEAPEPAQSTPFLPHGCTERQIWELSISSSGVIATPETPKRSIG